MDQLTFQVLNKVLFLPFAHELAVIEKVNDHVKKRYDIIPSAGLVEVHLIKTRKQLIAVKHSDSMFCLYMLSCAIVHKLFGETKINETNRNLLGSIPTVALVGIVNHHVVWLQIIEGSVRSMDKLEDSQQLNRNFQNISCLFGAWLLMN